eukprot:TRINITY_DN25962_c0_g1_i1.p1 TRINITY_DN25962_c0_g1~~TRINITY_DN25962_c0_g1_i1.p1  ORF type:complete len:206 (+),score=42.22 TRINITY_DN25962_c0_g1_i1:68-685(+)
MSAATATKNEITLRGSTAIVTEFFGYAINSILYQRGLYPPDTFKRIQKYNLAMLVTTDEQLDAYLNQVMMQLTGWLMDATIQKLVLVITSVETDQTLERWTFNIECDKKVTKAEDKVERSEKEVMKEIQAIVRQITASVTFLPLLNEPCTFDLLVYADHDADVPERWEESDPKYITNAQDVKLRTFTTKIHKVEPTVSYKVASDV